MLLEEGIDSVVSAKEKNAAQAPAEEKDNPRRAAMNKWRRMLFRGTIWGLLVGLLIFGLSVAPVWGLLWYLPVYSIRNCVSVKDIDGRSREAWRWVEGRTIQVCQVPGVPEGTDARTAEGVRELLRDAGLDIHVEVKPISKDILNAYNASLIELEDNGRRRSAISMRKLSSRLIALRDEDPHADILAVDAQIAECDWAFAMASFSTGTVLLTPTGHNARTAKHETAHLVGYMMHDSVPLFVFGYGWEGWPGKRDTLMMLLSNSTELSPRARDAIRSFWRRLEKRTGQLYLTPE